MGLDRDRANARILRLGRHASALATSPSALRRDIGALGLALPPLALAKPLALPIVVVLVFAAGFAVEIFGVRGVAMQQEIPQEKLSRLSAYDALGSWVLTPIGLVAAGPIAAAVGTRATFLGAAALVVVSTLLVLLSRDVRTLERRAVLVAEDVPA